jgi:hypothetical protein
MKTPKPNQTHIYLAATLGNFTVTWSILDLILDATIMRQLKINATRAAIVTSGLGFERKLSIVRCLLNLHGSKYSSALAKIATIQQIAHRNVLMHGHVHPTKNALRFVKVDTDHKMKARSVSLERDKFGKVVAEISRLMAEFQSEVGVTEAALTALSNIGKKLLNKTTGSPKPHTS